MKEFKYRNYSSSVPASVAGAELQRIRKRHDGIDTEVVVREAEPEDAPLHNCFEWDDSAAGHQYRKWQARQLIRSVVVVESGTPRPAFVNVRVDDRQYYQSVDVAVTRKDEWASAKQLLMGRIESARRAFRDLQNAEAESHPKLDLVGAALDRAHEELNRVGR